MMKIQKIHAKWPSMLPLLALVSFIIVRELASECDALWRNIFYASWGVISLVLVFFSASDQRAKWLAGWCLGALCLMLLLFREDGDVFSSHENHDVYTGHLEVMKCVGGGKTCVVRSEGGERFIVRNQSWSVGQVYAVEAVYYAANPPRYPGAFDELSWVDFHSASGFLWVGDQSVWVKQKYNLAYFVAKARKHVEGSVTHGLDGSADSTRIIRAMFLGEKPGVDSELTEDFRYSGTLHVFAVSGLHVMMVAGIVMLLSRLLGISQVIWIPFAITVMFAYVAITGWGTPAVRAGIMASVFLLGFLFQRMPTVINSMCVSALIALVIDAHQLFSIGFQLSYIVLLSIVVLSHTCSKLFAWIRYTDPFLPRSLFTKPQEWWYSIRRRIASAFAVGVAAWCGSAPIIAFHFKMVSFISIIAGVPMVLLLFIIMTMGSLSVILGTLHPSLSTPFNQVNRVLAATSHVIAKKSSDVPFSHLTFGSVDVPNVIVFDVPYGGSCIYIAAGGGVLIDTGGAEHFRVIKDYLEHHDLSVDTLVLTHRDSNHIGALDDLLDNYPIKQIVLPSEKVITQRRIRGVKEKADLLEAQAGDEYEIEKDVSLYVLYNGWGEDGAVSYDDRGLILKLRYKDGGEEKSILVVADAGQFVQAELVSQEIDLSADVVVLGKNYQEPYIDSDFLSRVDAQVAIASRSSNRVDQLRSQDWMERVGGKVDTLYYLDSTGAVLIELSDQLKVDPFLPE